MKIPHRRLGVLLVSVICIGCTPPAEAPANATAAAAAGAPSAPVESARSAAEQGPEFLPVLDLPGEPADLSGVAQEAAELRRNLAQQDFPALDAQLLRLHEAARAQGSDHYFDQVFHAAFHDPDSELGRMLDVWRKSSDRGYASAARGRHRLARGWMFRGGGYSADTAEERMEKSVRELKHAQRDLLDAVEREPRLSLAQADGIEIHMMIGPRLRAARDEPPDEAQARRATILDGLVALLERYPESYAVRRAAIKRVQPKWGGSFEEMWAFGQRAVEGATHPDFEMLPTYAMCKVADEMRSAGEKHRNRTLALLQRIEAHYPAIAADCLTQRASTEVAASRHREAARTYARFRALSGQPNAMADELAIALLRSGQEAEARTVLELALQQYPRDATLLCRRAGLQVDELGAEQALALVEVALKQEAVHESCMVMRSQLLTRLGRRDDALATTDKALELEPDNVDALIQRGASLIALDRDEEAMETLAQALASDDRRAAAWYWQGVAARNLGKADVAMQSLSRAVELAPDQAAFWHERGVVRVHLLKNPSAAESDFQQAVTHDDTLASAWFELAGARYKRRDCGFVPAFRRFVALCAEQECDAEKVRFARRWLDDPGLGKLCPSPPA